MFEFSFLTRILLAKFSFRFLVALINSVTSCILYANTCRSLRKIEWLDSRFKSDLIYLHFFKYFVHDCDWCKQNSQGPSMYFQNHFLSTLICFHKKLHWKSGRYFWNTRYHRIYWVVYFFCSYLVLVIEKSCLETIHNLSFIKTKNKSK